jgi:hypothetical protein
MTGMDFCSFNAGPPMIGQGFHAVIGEAFCEFSVESQVIACSAIFQ